MSYIMSTIKCGGCSLEMNVAFGIQGTTLIAQWPKECPDCKSKDLKEISQGWNAKEQKPQ